MAAAIAHHLLAAFVFLEEVICNKRVGGTSYHLDSKKRAEALLEAFLKWPLRGEDLLALALPRTGSELLLTCSATSQLVVDLEALKTFERENRRLRKLLR